MGATLMTVTLLLMAAAVGFILLGIVLRKDRGAAARRVAPASWIALTGFLITKTDQFFASPVDRVVLVIGLGVVLSGICYGCWLVIARTAPPPVTRDG